MRGKLFQQNVHALVAEHSLGRPAPIPIFDKAEMGNLLLNPFPGLSLRYRYTMSERSDKHTLQEARAIRSLLFGSVGRPLENGCPDYGRPRLGFVALLEINFSDDGPHKTDVVCITTGNAPDAQLHVRSVHPIDVISTDKRGVLYEDTEDVEQDVFVSATDEPSRLGSLVLVDHFTPIVLPE